MATIDFRGKTIHYNDSGAGSALVLLHGFTESQEIWNDYAEALSGSFRVITVDLPGHGKSDCVGDVHAMEEMAAIVRSVLDKIDVYQCVMIGHSMGGYVTLAFADMFPSMIRGFGLFHSHALADTDEAKTNRDRAIEIIRKDKGKWMANFIPDLFTSKSRDLFAPEIAELVARAKAISKESLIAAQEGMKRRKMRIDLLTDSEVPVLFIIGMDDTRVPFEKALAQMALASETHSLILRNVAHMGYIEAKNTCLHAIKAFTGRCFGTNI
ncbi:MAG: alpha/beta hydrolase [Bacteroidetes bacterium]|nr:alpha/beta hydrolase [Bacteroidota bacterium]MBU1717571.1 alpha/beta hydrolase [Bacteroidota bacterium]